MDFKSIKAQSKGRWLGILVTGGIPLEYLKNKNGPCPVCGGKDRFRWDNKNGDGGGFCHQCDFKGTGFTLLAKWLSLSHRKDFPKLLEVVSKSIGHKADYSSPNVNADDTETRNRDLALKIWNEAEPLSNNLNSIGWLYLKNRGLNTSVNIQNIRFHKSLAYYKSSSTFSEKYPALISKVTDIGNGFLGVHRIYLNLLGEKANVIEPKLVLGKIASGTVKFDDPKNILNIAEGIETALAVREMTNQPTWSAISATNLKSIRIPESVKKVIIWADLDKSGTGENAAKELATKLVFKDIEVVIKLPKNKLSESEKSFDWLDYHNSQNKMEKTNVRSNF